MFMWVWKMLKKNKLASFSFIWEIQYINSYYAGVFFFFFFQAADFNRDINLKH